MHPLINVVYLIVRVKKLGYPGYQGTGRYVHRTQYAYDARRAEMDSSPFLPSPCVCIRLLSHVLCIRCVFDRVCEKTRVPGFFHTLDQIHNECIAHATVVWCRHRAKAEMDSSPSPRDARRMHTEYGVRTYPYPGTRGTRVFLHARSNTQR